MAEASLAKAEALAVANNNRRNFAIVGMIGQAEQLHAMRDGDGCRARAIKATALPRITHFDVSSTLDLNLVGFARVVIRGSFPATDVIPWTIRI